MKEKQKDKEKMKKTIVIMSLIILSLISVQLISADEQKTEKPIIYVLQKDGKAMIGPTPPPPYLEVLEKLGLRVHLAAGTEHKKINWELIEKYPMMVINYIATGHGRGSSTYNEKALHMLLDQYLREGGSILYLGVEHMSSIEHHNELNRWLKPYGAEVMWGTVQDEKHRMKDVPDIYRQKNDIIWTDNITEHPATKGADTLFLRNSIFYAPYLRPISKLSKEWTVLVKSMPESKTVKLERLEGGAGYPKPIPGTEKKGAAPLIAVRQVGKGRLAIFPHHPGHIWFDLGEPAGGAIVQKNGNGKTKSDWLPLLRSLAEWLSEPARKNDFPGGAIGKDGFEIRKDWGTRIPIDWNQPKMAWHDKDIDRLHTVHSSIWKTEDWHNLIAGKYPSFKILVGARTELSGGNGSVKEWADAAKKAGFDGIAFREDILNFSKSEWYDFQEECLQECTDDFIALPGQQFKTMDGSRFIRFNRRLNYHLDQRINKAGNRVINQLHFYFDCENSGPMEGRGLPVNMPMSVKNNPAPWWSYRAYSAIPIYVYTNNVLQENNFDEWEKLVYNIEHPAPLPLHLLNHPSQVEDSANLSHLRIIAPSMKVLQDDKRWSKKNMGTGHAFNTVTYASDGPEIQAFTALNPLRTTLGSRKIDGSYQHRLYIRAKSKYKITEVELISNGKTVRRLKPMKKEIYYEIDDLHDRQRGIFLRVTDEKNREAIASSFNIHDKMMYLQWCADHNNILGAGVGINEDGDASLFRVPTQVKVNYIPSVGPGINQGEEMGYVPYGTDTAGITFGLKGTFKLYTDENVVPEDKYDLIPHLKFPYANRNLRVHRKIVDHIADREYWINPGENGERRIGSTYFTGGGGYFLMEDNKDFSLVHDDIEMHRNQGQPAFSWAIGKVKFKKKITLSDKKFPPVELINLERKMAQVTKSYHLPDISPIKPGRLNKTLKKGEWLTFEQELGNGTIIPLQDNMTVSIVVSKNGGSSMKIGWNPEKKSFQPGDELNYQFLIMRWPVGMKPKERLDKKIVDLLGLDGSGGYNIKAVKGEIQKDDFGFVADPEAGVLLADIPKGSLSMRMPLRLRNINKNWVAGIIRPGSRFFEPLSPDQNGVVWASFDPAKDNGRIFCGHPVICNDDSVVLQIFSLNDNNWRITAHNPNDKTVETKLEGTHGSPMEKFNKTIEINGGETLEFYTK